VLTAWKAGKKRTKRKRSGRIGRQKRMFRREVEMGFLKAAKVSEIPPGRSKVVEVGDEEVAVCNVDGKIYAIANVCTHDDGPLGDGYLMGDEIECPRHGARFNVRTGAVKTLPAIVPVPVFEVKVDGDDILVDVD
jgi:3-phenylpropionate/trans-cinnamate dioxygenase ferredoxin subunit